LSFVGELCLALGRTLPDILAMSAAEFAFWQQYHRRHGFPADRSEAATGIAGAYLGNLWGGKREPAELKPQFGPRRTSMKVLAAQLSQLPGAKVRRIPRPDRKAQAGREKADATEPAPKSRVLNPKR